MLGLNGLNGWADLSLSHGLGVDVRDDLVSGYLVLLMVTSLGF